MVRAIDTILPIIVLIGFGFWAYSKIKRQTLRDSFEDIKELLGFNKNE